MNDPIILKKPNARIDLAVNYAYIGDRNLEVAHRFRVNAEATFAALARNPGMGAPYEVSNPRLAELRCFRVNRFKNYLIFYLPIDNGIEVIRVLHAARNIQAVFEEDLHD
jgi:toxin ParE1/3/4